LVRHTAMVFVFGRRDFESVQAADHVTGMCPLFFSGHHARFLKSPCHRFQCARLEGCCICPEHCACSDSQFTSDRTTQVSLPMPLRSPCQCHCSHLANAIGFASLARKVCRELSLQHTLTSYNIPSRKLNFCSFPGKNDQSRKTQNAI
jgi:hypothetical protein